MTLNIITSRQRNDNQTYSEVPRHTHQDTYIKKDNNSAGEDVEKLEPSYTAGGNVKWYGCLGEQFCKKAKHSYHMTQQFHS